MRNKMNAKKIVVYDIKFDSKFEAETYLALREMEKLGEVKDIMLQIPITIIPSFTFGTSGVRKSEIIVDFKFDYYVEGHGWVEIYLETKGFQTEVSKIKIKLLKFLKKDLRKEMLFTYLLYKGRAYNNIAKQREMLLDFINKHLKVDKYAEKC